jgi:hypothetical protein
MTVFYHDGKDVGQFLGRGRNGCRLFTGKAGMEVNFLNRGQVWVSVVHREGRDGGQFLDRGQEWMSVVHCEGRDGGRFFKSRAGMGVGCSP